MEPGVASQEWYELVASTLRCGARVDVWLKTGEKLSGTLSALDARHLRLTQADGASTVIFLGMLGGWKLLEAPNGGSDPGPSGDASHVDQPTQLPAPRALPPAAGAPDRADVTADAHDDGDVQRRLAEISAVVGAHIKHARIGVSTPDLDEPMTELAARGLRDVAAQWDRLRQRFQYAVRMNELGRQFGRLQPITRDLSALVGAYPDVVSLRRNYAHFLSLLGYPKSGAAQFRVVASQSGLPLDWRNAAAVSLDADDLDGALESFTQLFMRAAPQDDADAWHVYIRIVCQAGRPAELARLETRTRNGAAAEDDPLLLHAVVYVLQDAGRAQEAARALAAGRVGPPLFALLANGPDKQNGAHPAPHDGGPSRVAPASLLPRADGHGLRQNGQGGGAGALPTLPDTRTDTASLTHASPTQSPARLDGWIYQYWADKVYGFLEGDDGKDYFFHRTAVIDDDLLDYLGKIDQRRLHGSDRIRVSFEPRANQKGPLATALTLPRTIEQSFQLARKLVEAGDYEGGVLQLRSILAKEPDFPHGAALLEQWEQWREALRVAGVPNGTNAYARAKRAQVIERDHEKAERLFKEAIRKRDHEESAVRDLAMLLGQLNRADEAIEILLQNQYAIRNREAHLNILIHMYRKTSQFAKAIDLLDTRLATEHRAMERAKLLGLIAGNYVAMEDYVSAERVLREALQLTPDNLFATRYLVFCLIHQSRLPEAEALLPSLVHTTYHAQLVELLETVRQASERGTPADVAAAISEMALGFSDVGPSRFVQFLIDRNDYEGVRDYRRGGALNERDVRQVLGVARDVGPSRLRERSDYYLTAARIIVELEGQEDGVDSTESAHHLFRSFMDRGDLAVRDGRLESARTWYSEALGVYPGDPMPSDEADVTRAIVQFLSATLGQARSIGSRDKAPSLDDPFDAIHRLAAERSRFFDALAYLMSRSRYTAKETIGLMFGKSSLKTYADEYLVRALGPLTPADLANRQAFTQLWEDLRRKQLNAAATVSGELRQIKDRPLTIANIEESLERLRSAEPLLFFPLDQRRAQELRSILDLCKELGQQVSFEEQERLSDRIERDCETLLEGIEQDPTRCSVEDLWPAAQAIRDRVHERLQNLYDSSAPQVSLRLAAEQFFPDDHQRIDIPIVVANRIGKSPAESLALEVHEESELFTVLDQEIRLNRTLRGGDEEILTVPLRVSAKAMISQSFSLNVDISYRTRSDERITMADAGIFTIPLYPPDAFVNFSNPYAAYAGGNTVENDDMFYGRSDLIRRIADVIGDADGQSKCFIIYGQKRAGKSSILYHLKEQLQADPRLLVVDVGNVGRLIDKTSSVPLYTLFLGTILRELRISIEDRVEEGAPALSVSFPDEQTFYTSGSPLVHFGNVVEDAKRAVNRTPGWQGLKFVLLIDEFSYFYDLITNGLVDTTFMKNWKALLQEDLFSAVLSGIDTMPKFQARFPNEFGTTKDEPVTYLEREDALKLIDEPIRVGGKDGESRYLERAKERIFDLTAGSPFYIQKFCDRLVNYMNDRKYPKVTQSQVEDVKNTFLRGARALQQKDFDGLIDSGDSAVDAIAQEDVVQVLTAIACNARDGLCERSSITDVTVTAPVDEILEDLVRRDVVERERGRYYRIRVGLFQDWLVAKYKA